MSSIRAIAGTLCCLFAVFVSSAAGLSNQEDGPHDGVAVYNVTLDHRAENGTIKLPFSFTYPTAAPADKLPLIMLMNGASVESYWYRRVIGDLASKGYVVASTDYYRERDFPAKPGCRQGVIIAPSAGFVNTLYNFIDGASKTKQGVLPDCLSGADTEQLLLLSHSLGGYVSFKLLGGGCESDSHEWDSSCEAYKPVLNSQGDNVVIGAVAFEGYLTGESAAPGKVQLPSNTFALYIAGQYNKKTATACEYTLESGGCASYVQLGNATHYGMNDFVAPSSTHQVPPCSFPIPADDPSFTTDRDTQDAGVDLIADIIDAAVRVRGGRGAEKAEDALRSLVRQPRVLESELHLGCLKKQQQAQVSVAVQ